MAGPRWLLAVLCADGGRTLRLATAPDETAAAVCSAASTALTMIRSTESAHSVPIRFADTAAFLIRSACRNARSALATCDAAPVPLAVRTIDRRALAIRCPSFGGSL